MCQSSLYWDDTANRRRTLQGALKLARSCIIREIFEYFPLWSPFSLSMPKVLPSADLKSKVKQLISCLLQCSLWWCLLTTSRSRIMCWACPHCLWLFPPSDLHPAAPRDDMSPPSQLSLHSHKLVRDPFSIRLRPTWLTVADIHPSPQEFK